MRHLTITLILGILTVILGPGTGFTQAEEASKKEESPSQLPEGVLARINGRPLTVDDYKRYLFFTVGPILFETFLDSILVEAEAKRLGISISDEAVKKETERELQMRLRFFQNDRDKYSDHLKARKSSYEEEVERIRREAHQKLLLEQCMIKSRKISEDDVKKKYQELYGKEKENKKTLDEVRDEIVGFLKNRRPDPAEKEVYLKGLRDKAKIEMPGMGEGSPEENDAEKKKEEKKSA